MLAALLLLALQTPEPLFVMAVETDDRYEAALFELTKGADRATLVDALMGRGPDAIPMPQGDEQDRVFTFGAAEGSSGRRDRTCRIALQPAGETDNLRPVMDWCVSLIEPDKAPTNEVPSVTAPPSTP